LFGKRLARPEVLARVRADATINDAVRRRALALADSYGEDPLGFADARRAVAQIGASRSTYGLAQSQARRACAFAPKNSLYLATLGMARYRLGSYQEALDALTQAEQLDAAQSVSGPATLAFLAMTRYKLGHKEEASRILTRLRAAINQSRWAKDEEAQAFFHEAEKLLAEKAPAAAK
jgi:tetratricopeptide (TPR) repeat protein